jgi:hypothetical protein
MAESVNWVCYFQLNCALSSGVQLWGPPQTYTQGGEGDVKFGED